MNIAILVCEKLTYECTAIGCLEALNNNKDAFKIYKDNKDVVLSSIFHCNGCKSNLEKDMEYKINQLKKKNVKNVHLAKCIEVKCNRYGEVKSFIEYNGFKVIEGTHK